MIYRLSITFRLREVIFLGKVINEVKALKKQISVLSLGTNAIASSLLFENH